MNDRIEVLHLSHTDISKDSRILKEMSAISAAQKYRVHGIGIAMDIGGKDSSVDFENKIEAIRVFSRSLKFLPKPIRHLMVFIEFSIPMIFKSLRLKPSVVHCHDTFVLPVAYLVSLICGAKLVYDAHELESQRNGLSSFLSKVTFFVERMAWHRISGLVSVSPSILEWYKTRQGYKKTALVLNSPYFRLNDDDFSGRYSEGYLKEKFNIPENRLVFIYVGLLERGRSIEMLLEAFSASDLQSHIVFLGYGTLGDMVLEASRRYERIHLHNAVPHEDVVAVVKSADIGLCVIENISLSDFHCLPNKLFEYIFAGLPVLASNFPDISKVVDDYQLGLCSDIDSDSVVRVIKSWEINPPERTSKDLSELSWSAQVPRLLELYDSLELDT